VTTSTETITDNKSGRLGMLAPITAVNDPCLFTRYLMPDTVGQSGNQLSPAQVTAIAVALVELLPDDIEATDDCWSVVGRARAVGRTVR
jgi:hypothetical protein